MAEIFVEQKADYTYRALRNHSTVCTADTQHDCAAKAHSLHPSDVVFVERVRDVATGHPDKWRCVYNCS